MKIAGVFFALVLFTLSTLGEQEHFYLGTYTDHSSSQGIYEGTLDSATGKLGPLVLAAPAVDPSFLALRPDGRTLYAAEETPGVGRVQAFRRSSGDHLFPLNERSAGGNGTCHVSVDPSGRDVLIANYGSGNIACFRLGKKGSIGPRTALVQLTGFGPNTDRQKESHAHSIYVSPDDMFVYSCDLGSDHVWIFKFDAANGTLVARDPPSANVPSGSGPRHLVFSRDGKFVYVSNEMGHSVTVFARNSSTGNLASLETVSTLPAGISSEKTSTAEIVLHPSGKWLYASNRGSDSISVFAINSSGRLKLIQNVAAGVKSPRSCAIDPTGQWIIAAGQDDNRIAVLNIDPLGGQLSATTQSAQVGSPVCVLFERR